jgi:hypothetical protein
MIQLFQDSTSVIPYYVNISNYVVAVSVLVSVLLVAIVFLWRKLSALEKMSIGMIKEGSATLNTVAVRLEDQQGIIKNQDVIINKLDTIIKNQDTIIQKLDK